MLSLYLSAVYNYDTFWLYPANNYLAYKVNEFRNEKIFISEFKRKLVYMIC